MQAYDSLAQLAAQLNPWSIFAVALILLVLGWLIGTPEHGLVLSASLVPIALLTAVEVTPRVLPIAYPCSLFAFYFAQQRIFKKLAGHNAEDDTGEKSLQGQHGTLIIKSFANESEAYFFGYKKSIPVETSAEQKEMRSVTVALHESGAVRPALDPSGELLNGSQVEVVGEFKGKLIVKLIQKNAND
jgi:hypothetical protein